MQSGDKGHFPTASSQTRKSSCVILTEHPLKKISAGNISHGSDRFPAIACHCCTLSSSSGSRCGVVESGFPSPRSSHCFIAVRSASHIALIRRVFPGVHNMAISEIVSTPGRHPNWARSRRDNSSGCILSKLSIIHPRKYGRSSGPLRGQYGHLKGELEAGWTTPFGSTVWVSGINAVRQGISNPCQRHRRERLSGLATATMDLARRTYPRRAICQGQAGNASADSVWYDEAPEFSSRSCGATVSPGAKV